MSHQTGIKASEELKEYFAASKNGSYRFLKMLIENESIEIDRSEKPQGNWEQDYDNFVLRNIVPKEACYIFYRFDTKSHENFEWLMICYTPDNAPVRQKMLYAASRATLKQGFGAGNITDELTGSVPDDVSLQGYKRHLEAKKAPAPLTMAEEELELIKKNEIRTAGVDAKHQTVQGIAFPFAEDALLKLQQLANGEINFVQLKLETSREEVHLGKSGNVSPAELASEIPEGPGSYNLYRFDHSHEGDYLRLFVFIYCMPDHKCPIKERMLYSSCKAPVLEVTEQLQIQIERKVEIDSPSEVSEKFLYDEVHPQKDIVRQQFSRPKPPAGRGPKRMTKSSK